VSPESTLSASSKGPNPTPIDLDVFQRALDRNTIQHHQRQDHDLAYTRHNTGPVDRPDHPTARTATADPNQILPEKRQENSAKSTRKVSSPTQPTVLNLVVTTLSSTNTTLAGVAQSVERVALTTAKRSTSRSWVRAPPSAIPIIQAHQSSCSFALLISGLTRGSWLLFGRCCGVLAFTDHQLSEKTMKPPSTCITPMTSISSSDVRPISLTGRADTQHPEQGQ
jgi:hypothetical protein